MIQKPRPLITRETKFSQKYGAILNPAIGNIFAGNRFFAIFCSITCFVAVLDCPLRYYTFLRIIVSLGSAVVIYWFLKERKYFLILIFVVILLLFNPIFPIYLHKKSFWIPLDILAGLLFLGIFFVKKQESKRKTIKHFSDAKIYERDRIVFARKIPGD